MKKFLILLLLFSILFSCQQHNKFHVSGKVNEAKGKMLYFEYNGLLRTTILDSVKLNKNGDFSFKSSRPAYPAFYRLRMDDKILIFAVDSCEDISIEANYANFATDYRLNGSESSLQIQKLRKSVLNIQRKVNEITSNLSAEEQNAKIADVEKDINAHKEMARKLILQNPRSMAAYYALYQKVNDTYLFSPYIKSDKPYCAAVATSFNVYMPEYERSKNLYNLVMDAIRTDQKQKDKEEWNEILAKEGKGYINIELPDAKNQIRKLSSLEGKVILIDFSAYEMKGSVDYTFSMRDLFNKYHSQGFEIYQISLDQNKSLWLNSTKTIPWICVRDEKGPETRYINAYNISSIPTNFLMNRKGTIIGRNYDFNQLPHEIEKNLK
jgi:peroxiredoxin